MDLFKNFNLFKSLTGIFEDGKDFFLGDVIESGVYDTATGKYIDTSSRGGGFLDTALSLGKAGFKAFQKMNREGANNPFERTQFTPPNITRFGAQQTRAAATESRWRPQNPLYRDAIIRRMKQVNFESNLQRLTQDTTVVRPTTRRKAPTPIESASIKRTMPAKRLT